MNVVLEESYTFLVNQFTTALLCLFFIYSLWRDYNGQSSAAFKRLDIKIIVPLFASIFVSLFVYFLSSFGVPAFFLAFCFSLAITFSIYDPKYAVSFFIFLLISRPWEIFPNELMLAMPRDVFFICFVSFLAHKALKKQFYFEWSLTTLLVLTFAAWTFFGAAVAGHSAVALNEYSEVFIKGIIAYLLIVNVIDREDVILPVQCALILAICEKAAVSFYKSFILGDVASGDRLTSVGILENSNDIAAILILGIPFLVMFFKDLRPKALGYFFALIGLSVLVLLVWQTKSRGAILSLGALTVTALWLKAQNKKIATILVVLGSLTAIGLVSTIKRDAADLEGSTSNRIIYWKAGLNMGIRNPLFGVGLAGYNRNLLQYAEGHVGTEGKNKTIHSTWLLALAETGIPGFLSYMMLWPLALIAAYRMKEKRPEYFLAIIAYGLAISFLSHTYMLYPYILIAMTIASARLEQKNIQTRYYSDVAIGSQVRAC